MKKYIILIIVIIAGLASIAPAIASDDISGGILDKKVNGSEEDYNSYVIYGVSTDTLFFTSSRPVANKRPIALSAEMFISTRPSDARKTGKKINEGWSEAERLKTDASRISEFTRGSQAISGDRIIFAAERDLSTETAKGTSYLFDLWEMTKRVDGFSLPEPLTEVNDIDAWDSQPALSTDSKVLFFVSNRAGGVGGLDIWYSVRNSFGRWTSPKVVPNINTAGDEVSPHCGADGKFYFSSDWDYAANQKGNRGRDIYRADYQENMGVLLPVNPLALDQAYERDAKIYGIKIPPDVKYNSDSDDEFPFITPDRGYIFITSNRRADYEKRNLYAFSLPKSRITLQVNVKEQVLGAGGEVVVYPTLKIGLPLTLVDLKSGVEKEIKSGEMIEVDADKSYQVRFSKFVEQECYQNKIEGPNELRIDTKKPFGVDTAYYLEALITRRKIEIPPIVFHSTDTLPYFITGYWYPNTSKNISTFRQRESQGFFDQTGFVDSTGHEYDMISQKIDSVFQSRIYKPLEDLLPGFQDFCQDTLYLKVTIHGYTDPRNLSASNEHPYRSKSRYKRQYPDETVTVGLDERGREVKIPTGHDMFKSSWPVDAENKDGAWIKLPDDGEEGNVLLSKLRAYFTFVTFDRDMQDRSPIYSQLRENGRVLLDAEGYGIDKQGYKERNLRDDPQSRRIEIYLDVLRPEDILTHKRLQGGKVKSIPVKQMVKKDQPPPPADISDEPKQPSEQEPSREVVLDDPIKPTNNSDDSGALVTSNILPPPEDKPKANTNTLDKDCYSLQYATYEMRQEAESGLKILLEFNMPDSRIVDYYDAFGNKSFRLRSGCYSSAQDAVAAVNNSMEAARKLGLNRKPLIVR